MNFIQATKKGTRRHPFSIRLCEKLMQQLQLSQQLLQQQRVHDLQRL